MHHSLSTHTHSYINVHHQQNLGVARSIFSCLVFTGQHCADGQMRTIILNQMTTVVIISSVTYGTKKIFAVGNKYTRFNISLFRVTQFGLDSDLVYGFHIISIHR